MQIRCASCARAVTVAGTGAVPERCPHCQGAPAPNRLGRYVVERLIAAGGMGEVWLAQHAELGTRVAIKLLPPLAADAEALRERFLREARLTASIDHPGVVRVLDCDLAASRPFLVLEYVAGRSLRSVLKNGPLPPRDAARVAAGVAQVVAAAHQHGVLHRDIKPDNVILGDDGSVRVLDFGIARALQDQEPITRTGEILGTPEYMAPEQLLDGADDVDQRTDVHALGVLLFELLTGRSPFHGANLFQALKLVESLVPPPPSSLASGVPRALDTVVAQALAKTKSERPATAAAFAAAVSAAMPPIAAVADPERRWQLANWILLLAVWLVAAGVMLWQRSSRPDADRWIPLTARQDAEATIAAQRDAPRLRAADSAALRQAVRTLDAFPDARQRRGDARLRLGDYRAALPDLAASLPDSDERDRAMVDWLLAHLLLPTVLDLPDWFAAIDRGRRDRLFAVEGQPRADEPPLRRACRLLAAGDAAGAFAAVGASAAAGHARTIALLAAHRACADRSVLAKLQATSTVGEPWVVELLAHRLDGDGAALANCIRDQAAGLDTDSADRWLDELAAAFVDASTPTGRLQSLAELAWLHGAGEVAPVWLAGLRLEWQRRDAEHHPLSAADAARLLRLCAATDARDAPAVTAVRVLLQLLANGVDAAEAELANLPAAAEPGFAALAAWRASLSQSARERDRQRAFAWLTVGRADAATPLLRALDAGDDDAAAAARAALAWLTNDATGNTSAWVAALRRPEACGALAPFVRGVASRGSDLAAVAAALPPDTPTAALLPLLHLAVRAGAAPDWPRPPWSRVAAELQERWQQEVCGGVH